MTHEDSLDCPACGAALAPRGARLFCEECRGVMVTSDELREMLCSIHPDEKRALEQQLSPLERGSRTCPRCGAQMDAFSLNAIPIDRCFTHGFWFDRDELAQVLQGDTSPEEFAADYQRRQIAATHRDFVTYPAEMLVRKLFRWLRRKRRERASREDAGPPPSPPESRRKA